MKLFLFVFSKNCLYQNPFVSIWEHSSINTIRSRHTRDSEHGTGCLFPSVEHVLALLILHGVDDGQAVHLGLRLHLVFGSRFELLVPESPEWVDSGVRNLNAKLDVLGL